MTVWRKTKRGLVVAIVLVAFGVGYYFGYEKMPAIDKVVGVDNKDNEIAGLVDFDPFWRAWNILNERFVPENATSTTAEERSFITQDMVWGAISGLTASLGDPHTVFFPPQENEFFKTSIEGNFEGVGMEIGIRDSVLTVVAPLKGTPAERAGI